MIYERRRKPAADRDCRFPCQRRSARTRIRTVASRKRRQRHPGLPCPGRHGPDCLQVAPLTARSTWWPGRGVALAGVVGTIHRIPRCFNMAQRDRPFWRWAHQTRISLRAACGSARRNVPRVIEARSGQTESVEIDVEENEARLGRVRHVSEDGLWLAIDLSGGGIVRAGSAREEHGLDPGDVVLIYSDRIERVSDDLWTEPPTVGVVRLKTSAGTIVDLGARVALLERSQTEHEVGNTVEVTDAGGIVSVLDPKPIRLLDRGEDDEVIIDHFKRRVSGELSFDDFAGYSDVIPRARRLIETPLHRRAQLETLRIKPVKGVLFTGEPGTGKTMLARIIASQAEAQFYEIRGPEIFSKWYGESERVLRAIFDDAAESEQERSIIFFDEIDSVAPQRSGEAHEASRRVVAQLLSLMDGFEAKKNVVVIAATNRPEDIDKALRRPGRFDWEINFPMPGRQDREAILAVSSRKHNVAADLPNARISAQTDGWSGADLTAIWTEAGLLAAEDGRDLINAEDYLGGWELVAAQRERVARTTRTESK
jgi:ATP-dependent 26S proteasome regulatory subunit